jgi:hypothetical protein
MSIGTIAYFGFGGVFVGLYSNAVRRMPLLKCKIVSHPVET